MFLNLNFLITKVAYPDLLKLMRDLKGMGENNCGWGRKTPLRRDT